MMDAVEVLGTAVILPNKECVCLEKLRRRHRCSVNTPNQRQTDPRPSEHQQQRAHDAGISPNSQKAVTLAMAAYQSPSKDFLQRW